MDTIKEMFVEEIAKAVPECDEVTKWIEDCGITDLVELLIEKLKDILDE